MIVLMRIVTMFVVLAYVCAASAFSAMLWVLVAMAFSSDPIPWAEVHLILLPALAGLIIFFPLMIKMGREYWPDEFRHEFGIRIGDPD